MTERNFVTVRDVAVESLKLDAKNPRLPERVRGSSQSEIIAYLYERAVLDEIAQSYMDHGYFQNEPLIVVADRVVGHVVIEGNRRLAALKILHGAPEADGLEFTVDAPREKVERLKTVPCFFASNREEVSAYIGFRHIGGIKTWEPEAKARHILSEVRQLVNKDSQDPFRELGRRIGSNTQGVRNSYLAIRILEFAREEFRLDVNTLQEERFGVWLRCMNSADIRRHIGLGRGRTYEEIESALSDMHGERLAEVIGDLTSKPGKRQSVLGDSRNVTVYGRVLASKEAYSTLRSTNDLGLARKVIDDLDTASRTWRLVEEVKLLMSAVHRAEVTEELRGAADELYALTRSLQAITKGRSKSEDS